MAMTHIMKTHDIDIMIAWRPKHRLVCRGSHTKRGQQMTKRLMRRLTGHFETHPNV